MKLVQERHSNVKDKFLTFTAHTSGNTPLMEGLDIPSTKFTPSVVFDPASCTFEVRGISMPEDAQEFYAPIISWVKENGICSEKKASVNFYLDYFNTMSSKLLLELFLVIDRQFIEGSELVIGWYYREEDEELKEVGEEYAQLLQCPIELRIY